MTDRLTHALCFLFVPGNRPERFSKALANGADCIILDLEDAVAPLDKASARQAVQAWLQATPAARDRVLVRINDDSTPWHADDLALCAASQPAAVVLPKCESPDQVAALRSHLAAAGLVLPLVETARGIAAVHLIAAAAGVARMAFGSLDYMVDMDLPALRDAQGRSNLALDVAGAQLVIASRAAGLASPVAGVTPELDAQLVASDMHHARSLGFGAKLCIHPLQLPAVREALHPSPDDVAWARRVLQAWEASAGGAIQLDGKMVDRPVVLKARRVLALAASTT